MKKYLHYLNTEVYEKSKNFKNRAKLMLLDLAEPDQRCLI